MTKKKEIEKKYKPILGKFNQNFKDFLKENPDVSMVKLSFALWWRLQLFILAILLPVYMLLVISVIILSK